MRILAGLRSGDRSKSEIAANIGLAAITGQLNRAVGSMLSRGFVKMTLPDKPNSRLQKYRPTAAGRDALADARSG